MRRYFMETNVRQLAESFKNLDKQIKELEKQKEEIKAQLVTIPNLKEYFKEDGVKVILQEGKSLSKIDVEKLSKLITIEEYIQISTVTEKTLTEAFPNLVAEVKVENGKGQPYPQVLKMTKEDKEIAGKMIV